MQENVVLEKLRKSYKFVDLVFGTHNIFKLAELMYTSFNEDKTVFDIWQDTQMIVENLPSERKYSFKTGVNIMYGCNNFCSYRNIRYFILYSFNQI